MWVEDDQWMWLLNKVNRIDHNLSALMQTFNQKEAIIMATLDDVLSEVQGESSKIDSYKALFDGLKQQLTDALASAGTVTPAMQAKIDDVFNAASANSAKIDAAISAGSPGATGATGP